ncbi:MAG: DUF2147 domain-containing protein [Hyphomicrobium sp.]|uniref:DUF2147 domain-containing protein n=1 Tax=Hyphomicrobium sp. TaxID=82 RepID=UPI003D0F3AC1
MPYVRHALRAAALASALAVSAPAFAADDLLGVWMNDTGRGAIEIKDCGGKICGHVVWLKDPASDAKGCGRQILGDVVKTGGAWGGDDAWIYSPEKKKNYNVEITPLADGTLKVKGYAGISFLSKTMIWTKAPDDLVRCNSTQEAAAPAAPKSEAAPQPADSATAPREEAPAAAEAPQKSEESVAENGEKEGIDLEGMAGEFGDVFTMKDGKCKVDTPWVKLDIDCKKKEEEPGQKN